MNSRLVLLDFDGTIADTFQDSPGGMNVNVASRLAISEVFGRNGALAYDESGGLKNREPSELVRDISEMVRTNGLDNATSTEWFVNAKLSRLVPEISPHWPQLYPGAKDFLQRAGTVEYPIDIGIISSGHDAFIKRVLEANRIDPSSMIVVTSDLLRQRKMPLRPRYKPHTYQFAEAHRRWLVSEGILPLEAENYGTYTNGNDMFRKANIAYVGDDPVKDGGLAREAGVSYIYVPFTKPGFEPDESKGQIAVSDFLELGELLHKFKGDLENGTSFSEVFVGRSHEEVFPSLPEGAVYSQVLKERSFR